MKGLGQKESLYKRKDTEPISVFDTIVITHWDGDHYAGVLKLLTHDLELRIKKGRKNGEFATIEEF